MRRRLRRSLRSALTLPTAFLATTALVVFAGPAEYSVQRTVDQEPTVCEDTQAPITLTGIGPGSDSDLLTVIETIDVDINFDSLEITDISNDGVLADVLPPAPGMFDGRLLVEIPTEPYAEGEGNLANTTHNGGDSYTSVSNTGHDIWITGDAMEFAYTQLDGDFDVSVRIDDYHHSTNVGCWGKYGIMARQTLEPHSRMVSIQNHGPQGQPGGMPGADPGECIDPASQSTSILTRRAHKDTERASAGFIEAIYGEPESGDGAAKPTEYNNFDYLRLTRRGDLFEGWVTSDALVEGDPTNDLNWEKLEIGPWDGGDYVIDPPEDSESFRYVGFANSEGINGGVDTQTVDFTVINWTAIGGSCYAPQASLRTITWEDVTRAEVTAGLSYTLSLAPSAASFSPEVSGELDDGGITAITGPESVELSTIDSVGTLTMRTVGRGFGTGTVDGSVFEMTGSSQDIWNEGDDLNFMYQRVTGDFDATESIVDRNLVGGPFAKYGLMARQTCHFDSRADYITARTTFGPVGGPRFAHRGPHRNPAGWSEGYQVELDEVPAPDGSDINNPDYFRLIRTGSQITGYIARDDPGDPGNPFHWCIVGSRNHIDHPEHPVEHGDLRCEPEAP